MKGCVHGLVAVLAALLLAWTAGTASAQDGAGPRGGASWAALVSHVVDGDSIWVRPSSGGRRVRLRIDGIDAPEICQRHGVESRNALRALALGQRVHVTVRARDRWGRAIATVVRSQGQIDLGLRMVADGWAWADGRSARQSAYRRAQAQARQTGRGLFAERQPEPPADFRRRHGPCGAAKPAA
jgi:endonuclease YncB( thermonuclease family)